MVAGQSGILCDSEVVALRRMRSHIAEKVQQCSLLEW